MQISLIYIQLNIIFSWIADYTFTTSYRLDEDILNQLIQGTKNSFQVIEKKGLNY